MNAAIMMKVHIVRVTKAACFFWCSACLVSNAGVEVGGCDASNFDGGCAAGSAASSFGLSTTDGFCAAGLGVGTSSATGPLGEGPVGSGVERPEADASRINGSS